MAVALRAMLENALRASRPQLPLCASTHKGMKENLSYGQRSQCVGDASAYVSKDNSRAVGRNASEDIYSQLGCHSEVKGNRHPSSPTWEVNIGRSALGCVIGWPGWKKQAREK